MELPFPAAPCPHGVWLMTSGLNVPTGNSKQPASFEAGEEGETAAGKLLTATWYYVHGYTRAERRGRGKKTNVGQG